MMIYFILLASGTTGDKGIDKRGEAWPSKVAFNDGFDIEASCITCGG